MAMIRPAPRPRPSRAAKAAPTEGSAKAAPTEGSAKAAPTEGSAKAAPTEGSAKAAPTEGSAKAAPTKGSAAREAAGSVEHLTGELRAQLWAGESGSPPHRARRVAETRRGAR